MITALRTLLCVVRRRWTVIATPEPTIDVARLLEDGTPRLLEDGTPRYLE